MTKRKVYDDRNGSIGKSTTHKIKEYAFSKQKHPEIEFEVGTLEDLFSLYGSKAIKPHKLNFFQLIYITKGEGFHSLDFQNIPYKPGTLIPVARNQVQIYTQNPDAWGFLIVFTPGFITDEQNLYRFYSDFMLFNSQILPVQLYFNEEEKQEFEHLVIQMQAEYESPQDFAKVEILRCLVKEFILKAERIKRATSSFKMDSSMQLFKAFEDELETHLTERLGIEEFSGKLAVSAKKLNQVVKRCTGKTAKQFLDERTILEIKRIISYTEFTVKEIAFQLGFDEPTNMIKFFRKHTGMPPGAFRDRLNR